MTADELRRAVRGLVADGRVAAAAGRRRALVGVLEVVRSTSCPCDPGERLALVTALTCALEAGAVEQRHAVAVAGRWVDAQARAARVVVPVGQVLGVADVAAWVGVGPRWVRRLVASGELRATRVGSRSLSFRRSDVARFLRKRSANGG